MVLNETQVKDAAKVVECIDDLESFRVRVTNLNMKLTIQEMIDSMKAMSLDGDGLIDEFKARALKMIDSKQKSLRTENLDPLGIVKDEA